jgi:hypothetical protein
VVGDFPELEPQVYLLRAQGRRALDGSRELLEALRLQRVPRGSWQEQALSARFPSRVAR